MNELQFLRPEWFFMCIPVLILAFFSWKKAVSNRSWKSVIDPRLINHVLEGQDVSRRKTGGILLALFIALLVIVALAGPVWEQLPQPVFKQQSALVVALDLSRSMDAQDIKPSRLARARLKLLDLLKERKEGQTALLVYAATAYTVTPLTDDNATIESLVSSLSTEIMPAQGSRADIAVKKALELFENAGVIEGDILLITDGMSVVESNEIRGLVTPNFRLSVLAAGTEEGAPIALPSGGFLKDIAGSIVVAKTQLNELEKIAESLGGVFSSLSVDDRDIDKLTGLFNQQGFEAKHEQLDLKTDRWYEEGPWLLLLVMPLVALWFRRGVLASFVAVIFMAPLPQPVQAFDWDQLWKNENQLAQQKLQQGEAEQAAELFNQPDWKAAAQYKSAQYEQALSGFETQQTEQGLYNRANTLVKMGQLEQALDGYNELLQENPEHEDAIFNRNLVEQALQKQQQQQDSGQQSNQQSNQKQDQQKKNQQSDSSKQDQQSSQSSSQQNQEQDSNTESSAEGKSEPEQQSTQQQDQKEMSEQESNKESEQESQQSKAEKDKNDRHAEKIKNQQMNADEKMSQQAEAQWLRKIPDDPGGLLRNKFKYQYSRQQPSNAEAQPW